MAAPMVLDMNGGIKLRNLTSNDTDAVYHLGVVTFDWLVESVLWQREVVAWYVESAQAFCYVAENGQAIVGFVLCFVANGVGCVQWIAVDKQYQRRKLGAMLLHRSQLTFQAFGIKSIVAFSRENDCANHFFEQHGFHSSNHRKVELYYVAADLRLPVMNSQIDVVPECACTEGEWLAEYDALANIYEVWAAADPAACPSHNFYVQLCSESDGTVVELGVGTGRIAIDVAKQGKAIIGIDIAESMLALCRRRADEEGVTELVQLIYCDVLDLHLPEKARLITLPFRTIGHFLSLADKKAALKSIYAQLELGGLFVFDHYIFNEAWARSHNGVPRLMHGQVKADGSGLFIWDTYLYDFDTQQMNCLITIEESNREGLVTRRAHYPLHFSWLLPEQVKQMAEDVGFVIESIYGDFAKGKFGPEATEQVWYLRRPQ